MLRADAVGRAWAEFINVDKRAPGGPATRRVSRRYLTLPYLPT